MLRARWWILLGVLAAAGASCRRGATPDPAASDADDGAAEAAAASEGAAPGAERAAAPERFEWTAAPTLDGIPVAPVAGEVHGAPFPVAQVVFEPMRRGWVVLFLEQPLPDPTAPVSGMRFLRVDLPAEPSSGAVQQRALAYGDSMFHVDSPGEPGSFTIWTADNAWVLELTEWDVRPWDPAGPEVQSAGRAVGRVAVCYRGGGEFRNAWVAGTFAGALVRYTREPRFEPACPAAPPWGG
ncbi:MAG: hypothetical protein JXB32_25125 [Deltaproteobacteria bacterium]|nr:hypothetical protein [Deltaproteobacteria bacterium]